MNDEQRAMEALRSLASYKLEQSGINKRVEKKAKKGLRQIGIDPESAAKSAALMKIINDASQGRMQLGSGDFNIEGRISPEERMLRFGWKKDF